MDTNVVVTKCPFCKSDDSEIGFIKTNKITICLCSKCHSCWEFLNNKITRLTVVKDYPETSNEFLLCFNCWREMKLDKNSWRVVCPDPICGFSRKMPGLSKEKLAMKEEYINLRTEIYGLMYEGKEVPPGKLAQLKVLGDKYRTFKTEDEDINKLEKDKNAVKVNMRKELWSGSNER